MRNKEKYNAYMKEYMNRKYHSLREKIIQDLGGKCAKCGSLTDLEIDHVDREKKKFDLAKNWSYSEGLLKQELSKCQLLCHSCHEEKSIVDLGFKRAKGNHGTISTYRYCKCDECKAAKSLHEKQKRTRGVKVTQ